MNEDEVMIASEVATLLKLHVKTVYKLFETGDIPGKRIGRSVRFRRVDVLKLVTPNGSEPGDG
jgi:excisionase family DNA binding protein